MGNAGITGAAIRFQGIVQGVGFRPLVYRRACFFNLKGMIRNTETGVFIKVDGRKKDIEEFYRDILKNPPSLAEIHTSSITYSHYSGFKDLAIVKSLEQGRGFTPLAPDSATCTDCLKEIDDPEDRRYRYPFTNCTNCGPRFTIINSIPYDRKNTTMSVFPMCPECTLEYENPPDRRYHAQPNACPVCGPQLTLILSDSSRIQGDPFKKSASLLNKGKVLAIKGLGGYHLAVSPEKAEWVSLLRKRKGRPAKPFALMVRDIETAEKYCRICKSERTLLLSCERPIVLLARRRGDGLPCVVAPDTDWLGVMLPYTPLHHILLEEGPEVLIMTSANMSEEPLIYRDREAFESLRGIADALLTHNREIERPCDDSVFFVVDDIPVPVRRSRGWVPRAIKTGLAKTQLFSAGANEKNTFCVFKDGKAFISHHIGDLNNEKSVDAYNRGVHDFLKLFRVKPAAAVCDLHPDYVSTRTAERLADEWNVPVMRVQHHHAHIASVLGENMVREKVIGVALDGTGFGPDGTVWGGEFLIADTGEYTRAGHYAAVPMPGGEKCITEIDRMAVSYLLTAYGSLAEIPRFDFIESFDAEKLKLLEKMVHMKINTPLTSSCGRLFDAVSALLGLCSRPTYDAQGAVLLEKEAGTQEKLTHNYSYFIDEHLVIHFKSAIRDIVGDMQRGVEKPIIAQRFHSTIIVSGVELCSKIRSATGIGTAALSGGVFQNRIVFRFFRRLLKQHGFSVVCHSLVPPNDGGISLGQGVVALTKLKGGCG